MSKQLRALIVEDSKFHAALVLTELRRGGYEPIAARVETADDLSDALARRQWDLVISSHSIPNFTSTEALTILKRSHLDIPFIIVSDALGEEVAVKAMRSGANDYLVRNRLARLVPAVSRELKEAENRIARKRAEMALRESQAHLIEAQRIANLGSWDWNIQTNVVSRSAQVARIFGVSPQDFDPSYEGFMARVHPDDRQLVTTHIEEALNRKKPLSMDYRIVRPDGDLRHLHAEAEVTFSKTGEPIRVLGTILDITERKRLEEQLRQSQKMEALGQLVGGVAHDFNNLLTAIKGFSELALNHLEPDDHPVGQFLRHVQTAAERAANLTGQLLAFSRRQILRPRVLDLNDTVGGMDGLIARSIGEDIEFSTALEPALRPIKADSNQIEQVLLNLAVNARDAMPEGGKLVIETANVHLDDGSSLPRLPVEPKAGSYALLRITDTGVGMDEETQARIFEPFFTTKKSGRGTGLGLSTVYGIVKQSGGYITVDSQPGRGASFAIYLPQADATEEIQEPEGRSYPELLEGSETILVVEDDEAVLNLAARLLEGKGYRVLVAGDPELALQVCRSRLEAIDLLVADVVLPLMSGVELAKLVKAVHPETRVLFMSGYAWNAIRQGGLDVNTPLLRKPFVPQDLLARVRAQLNDL